ncbi:MAG: aromatic ring-hydroxylating dioxygenase subunit alpha [Pseudomonadota bacterium]
MTSIGIAKLSGADVTTLVDRQRRGQTLEQPFYCDEAIFQLDMRAVIERQWLLVDHESRIPSIGDYFIVKIAGEEIILARTEEGVAGYFNVCRHRGSRVCLEQQGNAKSGFTCPYHAWHYGLDGALRSARLMPAEFDATAIALETCHTHVCDGLIFVCLQRESPPDFATAYASVLPMLQFHELQNAKVATRLQFPMRANWKLVCENFFECYHCNVAHPELMTVHSRLKYLAYGAGPNSGPKDAMEKFSPELDEWESRARAMGHPTGIFGDDENTLHLTGASRLPIKEGAVSETADGGPAAPLMGCFNEYDGGTTAITFNPLGTVLMPNDYAMVFRFTPRSALATDVEVIWLVDRDAREGRDYDVEKLTWLWRVTTEQDGTITENNQAGVMSSRYQPGTYATHEVGIETLKNWYLNRLRAEVRDGP